MFGYTMSKKFPCCDIYTESGTSELSHEIRTTYPLAQKDDCCANVTRSFCSAQSGIQSSSGVGVAY